MSILNNLFKTNNKDGTDLNEEENQEEDDYYYDDKEEE